jgi:hypothetical protein
MDIVDTILATMRHVMTLLVKFRDMGLVARSVIDIS